MAGSQRVDSRGAILIEHLTVRLTNDRMRFYSKQVSFLQVNTVAMTQRIAKKNGEGSSGFVRGCD